jgi:hypothetical protein
VTPTSDVVANWIDEAIRPGIEPIRTRGGGGHVLTLLVPGALATAPRVSPSPRRPVFVNEQREGFLPESVEHALVDFGGLNIYGQPNYRIVWGWQRGDWFGGEWRLKYQDRDRHKERWHLEKWVPAESFGSPEKWYQSAIMDVGGEPMNVLGEFPGNGDYVRVVVFENYHTGEYVEPDADMVREAITRNRQYAERSRQQIHDKIQAEMDRKKKAVSDKQDDILGDAEAAFAFKTWMPVSGPMTPEHRRRDTWEPPR